MVLVGRFVKWELFFILIVLYMFVEIINDFLIVREKWVSLELDIGK